MPKSRKFNSRKQSRKKSIKNKVHKSINKSRQRLGDLVRKSLTSHKRNKKIK